MRTTAPLLLPILAAIATISCSQPTSNDAATPDTGTSLHVVQTAAPQTTCSSISVQFEIRRGNVPLMITASEYSVGIAGGMTAEMRANECPSTTSMQTACFSGLMPLTSYLVQARLTADGEMIAPSFFAETPACPDGAADASADAAADVIVQDVPNDVPADSGADVPGVDASDATIDSATDAPDAMDAVDSVTDASDDSIDSSTE